MSDLNTIYIISKGRPQCKSAQYLTDIGYTGEWFIVCGDNDETINDYIERWGEHVLIFNHCKEWEETDMLDNLGESQASGVAVARNAVRNISFNRGELRHWVIDDDIYGIRIKHPFKDEFVKLEGEYLEKYLEWISEFAFKSNVFICGINGAFSVKHRELLDLKNNPYQMFNVDNLNKDIKWRGRICEDVFIKSDAILNGSICLQLNFILYSLIPGQDQNGGNEELLGIERPIKFAQYNALLNPICKIKYNNGRFRINNVIPKLTPMLISDKYRKQ